MSDVCSMANKSVMVNRNKGDIVWSKWKTYRWWPSIIISHEKHLRDGNTPKFLWVFWFGDHKISKILYNKVVSYHSEFINYYSCKYGQKFDAAIFESLSLLASRVGYAVRCPTSKNLIVWAEKGFFVKNVSIEELLFPNGYPCLPDWIESCIKPHMRALYEEPNDEDCFAASSDEDCIAPSENKYHKPNSSENAKQLVEAKKKAIDEICIACNSADVAIVFHHPIFHGGLCKECQVNIEMTMFVYGNDGKNVFCVICGQVGILLVCNNSECNRSYCVKCINLWGSRDARKIIEETDPWWCFVCKKEDRNNILSHGYIVAHENYENRIVNFFINKLPFSAPKVEKGPITVLSLFDGLSAAKVALDALNIQVKTYYASEIDKNALAVAAYRHEKSIVQLGDVRDITKEKIQELGPFDLIVGGSPCNELSLVNPARKGIHGEGGNLFFRFSEILENVKMVFPEHPFFWLFENVCAMPIEYRSEITRTLKCQPVMLDSKFFSAQKRQRYFWGNIPGLHCCEEYWEEVASREPVATHYLGKGILLDDCILTQLNRKSKVQKVLTVTTKRNSLLQGKAKLFPVEMNGEPHVLIPVELEELFGFPKHYTDLGFSTDERQKLLGKAWSVPVIKYIFTPLKFFFKLND